MKDFDLFIFMGQSNMAGRGSIHSKWTKKPPEIIKNAGYEFRAISNPKKLFDIKEPFGVHENNPLGIWEPMMKTGSMVTAFVNEYYKSTNKSMIAVSASKGGSAIEQWQNHNDYLTDAIQRFKKTIQYCDKNNIKIRHKFMVWCQGESDGDIGTLPQDYQKKFEIMLQNMLSVGIETCFLISIGHYNGTKNIDYSEIIDIQHKIPLENKNVIMVSDDFIKMKSRGLMKDAFHYYQAAYNEVGKIAGKNTAEYVDKIEDSQCR